MDLQKREGDVRDLLGIELQLALFFILLRVKEKGRAGRWCGGGQEKEMEGVR